MEVVANLMPPLWDMGESWFTRGGQEVSPPWWEAPQRRLRIIEGCAEGVKAEYCGQLVGVTWAAELVCGRYGVLAVAGGGGGGGGGIWWVAHDIIRSVPRVSEVCCFRPPPPLDTIGSAACGVKCPQGVTSWVGRVGRVPLRQVIHTLLHVAICIRLDLPSLALSHEQGLLVVPLRLSPRLNQQPFADSHKALLINTPVDNINIP